MNPEDIIKKQVIAYNARDIEAFVNCHDPNVELYNFADPTPFAIGRQQVRAIYGPVFEKSPNLNTEIINRIVMDNTVMDHELVTGRDGLDMELVAIYEVDNNLIMKAYFKRK